MKILRWNARSAATSAIVILCLFLNTEIAKADTILDISVKATFAPGTTNQVIDPTPNFYLTGHFTLDDTTAGCVSLNCFAPITSFDMVLTPVGGNPYEISSKTGSALANRSDSTGDWRFLFSDSNASVLLPTINHFPFQPLIPGGTYYLGAGATTYPDGRLLEPLGNASASASFGGITGWTYGIELGDVLSSGYIKVDRAVPEPPELSMLLVGIGVLLAFRRFGAWSRKSGAEAGLSQPVSAVIQ